MSTLHGPALNVVVPERKVALSSENSVFTTCLTVAHDERQDSLLHVTQVGGKGVYYIDGALSEGECKRLCHAMNTSDSLSFWSPQGRSNEDVRRFRDADTIELNAPGFVEILWERLHTVIEGILEVEAIEVVGEEDAHWERELVGKWAPVAFNHDLLLARYPAGGAFAPHTDGRAVHDFNTRSFYSVIVFLNTVPRGCGGGTRFYTDEAVRELVPRTNADGKVHWTSDAALATAEVDAVAGRLLLFQQALVHEGVPPLSEHRKYIIRSDIMFRRSPALCDSATDQEAYKIFKQAEDLAEEGRVDDAVPLFRRALKLSPDMARIMGQG